MSVLLLLPQLYKKMLEAHAVDENVTVTNFEITSNNNPLINITECSVTVNINK